MILSGSDLMKELEKFLIAEKIDNDFYDKSVNSVNFNLLTQKINTKEYQKLINQLFWLSMTLYRISFMSYFESISSEKNGYLKRNSIIVYYPFLTFSSEICRLTNDKYIYSSLLSTIARQIIEQICVVKEVDNEKIADDIIVKAMIESHNKHVGAESLNIEGLNTNNDGILKVFNTGRKFGNLARKYNYSFLYNLYSGDIHHISTIDKIFPQVNFPSNNYNEAYLKTLIGLIKESIMFVNSFCNKLTKKDIELINKYKFVDVKC